MAQTKLMRADDIAHAFNGATERKYWQANIGGTRVNPVVRFNSRASMVAVEYHLSADAFTVAFSKTQAAFGDYLASAYRSLHQVLTALKAAGLPFDAGDESACLRLEYDPLTRVATVRLANLGDPWPEAEPIPFKVQDELFSENAQSELDPPSTGE